MMHKTCFAVAVPAPNMVLLISETTGVAQRRMKHRAPMNLTPAIYVLKDL